MHVHVLDAMYMRLAPSIGWMVSQAYIFNNKHDATLLYVLKKADPLSAILSINEDGLLGEFKLLTDMAARERGEEPAMVDTRPSTVNEPESDFLVALQSNSLTRDHIDTLSAEHEDVIKEHQTMASKLVAQLVRLIDSSLLDKEVLQQLRMSHVGKLNTAGLPSGALLIFYDVKVSSEDAKRPMLRKPALRKSHIDRLMQLALKSRTPDGSDEMTSLPKNEVILITDAGRDGNASALMSSVKLNDTAPLR